MLQSSWYFCQSFSLSTLVRSLSLFVCVCVCGNNTLPFRGVILLGPALQPGTPVVINSPTTHLVISQLPSNTEKIPSVEVDTHSCSVSLSAGSLCVSLLSRSLLCFPQRGFFPVSVNCFAIESKDSEIYLTIGLYTVHRICGGSTERHCNTSL